MNNFKPNHSLLNKMDKHENLKSKQIYMILKSTPGMQNNSPSFGLAEAGRNTDRQANTQTDRQTHRQTGKHRRRQTHRQANTQTDRHTEPHG